MISGVTWCVDGSQGSSFYFKYLAVDNRSEIVALCDVTTGKFVNLASFLEENYPFQYISSKETFKTNSGHWIVSYVSECMNVIVPKGVKIHRIDPKIKYRPLCNSCTMSRISAKPWTFAKES